MFKNLVKIAFKNLLKNRGVTLINIFGLALGLASCLLIVFYVVDELSFDKFNTNANRIYRVNTDISYGGNASSYAIGPPPLAAEAVNKLPQVEKAVRITTATEVRFKKGVENISEPKVANVDSTFFDVFTFPILHGDPHKALAEPHSIVLTERAAVKYFNTTDAVGRVLTMANNNENFKVTGVIANMPEQSHFNYDFLISMSTNEGSKANVWNSFIYSTYLLARPGTDATILNKNLDALFQSHFEKQPGFNKQAFAKNGNYVRVNLTPLTDIHLRSNRQYELGTNSDVTYVYIFSSIALFILLLACINFMNISTARSANRAREVGVRKVLGSPRKMLIFQFLTESTLITLAAATIAVLAAWALLPAFNNIAGKALSINTQTIKWLLPALFIIVLTVGVLAGAYPAFYLSAFQPIAVLKGKLSNGFKGSLLRNSLVVLQFSVSIFLIIGTIVIYNQLNYIQQKDLGYDRSHVLVIKNTLGVENARALKNELKQIAGVNNASLSGFLPTGTLRQPNSVFKSRTPVPKNAVFTEIWPVDEDYLPTMSMKLSQGRNFEEGNISDSSKVIINETAARALGYAANPIGKSLYYEPERGERDTAVRELKVIGVIKDFNFKSLRDNITPVVMMLQSNNNALSVKLQGADVKHFLPLIEAKWNKASPNQQFEYSFMGEDFNAAYRTEQRTGQLFLVFATLAIVIAGLGLFSLAAYAAEQRNKEIGIRKVLGASVSSIVSMLSKDFIKLVMLSFLIAAPLAWLVMHKWLDGFAYRQSIQWWVVAVAGAGSLVIAFATISTQSFKAAVANPAESLKSE
ncbi:FtsX-like permease family protein [Mucilaginibacter achroorhodeus]|uniref:FtsX-like permease family protein n=1 Tax=Mucilaginibacter achroorhodeus TaxID=2599294 RepID=A0A563U9J0_9SPHI|nr:ABC transporter permease [Mucilaginibacter achroorhodeus]TWR27953.1 FtsX-like permease family protein [Mucilaginibacter achroorhodeus]